MRPSDDWAGEIIDLSEKGKRIYTRDTESLVERIQVDVFREAARIAAAEGYADESMGHPSHASVKGVKIAGVLNRRADEIERGDGGVAAPEQDIREKTHEWQTLDLSEKILDKETVAWMLNGGFLVFGRVGQGDWVHVWPTGQKPEGVFTDEKEAERLAEILFKNMGKGTVVVVRVAPSRLFLTCSKKEE